ncbi:MAG TPA: serine hydrolase [Candidatus Limnocylindria bacterium]|nr:serine hydrolase [Candidatus Limnocylindria bacterium]
MLAERERHRRDGGGPQDRRPAVRRGARRERAVLRGVSGNAGVFSDINDMALFARMLARGWEGFLSPGTFRMATSCQTGAMAPRRGLGFLLSGTPGGFFGERMPADSFGHTGFPGTSLAVDPHTGFFAVLLSNRIHPSRDNERLFPFRRAFHDALYAEYVRGHLQKR